MQVVIPEQAIRMRTLAAQLRRAAARTSLAAYQAQFDPTACQLEYQPRPGS
jgi:hypothetical protein